MFTRPALTPEQGKAIDVLEESLADIKSLTVDSVPFLEEVTIQDSKVFIHSKVSTSSLPRGTTWLWNQSRSRKILSDITGNIRVSFYKLNTRSSKHASELPPNYKLWVFHLTIQPNNKDITFLWCERGYEVSPFDDLSINDFEFLAPFLCVPCAMEFGWV